jgi:hypothetical protein
MGANLHIRLLVFTIYIVLMEVPLHYKNEGINPVARSVVEAR